MTAYTTCFSTQWQYTPGGIVSGLRYADGLAALRVHAASLGVEEADIGDLFALVQVIESAIRTGVGEVVERRAQERDRERRTDGR